MTLFFDNLPIYYINLDNREDRNNSILNQLKILNIQNFTRITAIDQSNVVFQDVNLSKSEYACSLSHLIAISNFIKSNSEFAMICEDDVDFLNAKKINFNFIDMIDKNKEDICIQTSVVTQIDKTLYFKIKSRSFYDFGTTSYIINKNYGKKILNTFYNQGKKNFKNFIPQKININNNIIETRPVADEMIYCLTETESIPIFSYILTESSIGNSKEYYSQFYESKKQFINHWALYDIIKISDIKDI